MEYDVVKLESQIQIVFHAAYFLLDILVHFSLISLGLAAMVNDALMKLFVLLVSKELTNTSLVFLAL